MTNQSVPEIPTPINLVMCQDCKELKPTSEFYPAKLNPKRFYCSSYCKPCAKKRRQTDHSMIRLALNRSIDRTRREYSHKGIKNTLTIEQVAFLWERDNAKGMKRASLDRIETTGDYTLENCRFIEHAENSAKDKRKAVLQYDLEGNFIKEWDSPATVAKHLNCHPNTINAAASGANPTGKGFVWKYKSDI